MNTVTATGQLQLFGIMQSRVSAISCSHDCIHHTARPRVPYCFYETVATYISNSWIYFVILFVSNGVCTE
uniref:Uncharacterized protein n=1 Tax=Anguilla anguilla TaxID=7936 RepID=A0A0E9WIP9_ANGAN